MRYRDYGRNGPAVSALGFGVMRLPPRRKGDWGTVNFTRSVEVMRRALAGGVNFFDSHHLYHGGLSEEAIGRALKGWKGRRVVIQTKAPFYEVKPLAYFKNMIVEALAKTGVDCIDYLLFHSMDMKMFKRRGRQFFALTDWAMKRGYIRHRGFSSHDTAANVKAFIDTGEFSAMLLSYNWLNPAMADVLAYGADKGLGVSVMNPLGGGALSAETPQVRRLLPRAKSAAEIALRYVLGTPGVDAAFSGMNTVSQVDENVAVAGRKTYLTVRQRETMLQRLAQIQRRGTLVCTACGYCMPCPHGVDIPANLALLIRTRLLGLKEFAEGQFKHLRTHPGGDKSALPCKRCGKCLPKCPIHAPIIDLLAETAELLARK